MAERVKAVSLSTSRVIGLVGYQLGCPIDRSICPADGLKCPAHGRKQKESGIYGTGLCVSVFIMITFV